MVLLLTGTVNVGKDVPFVTINDEKTRLEQYCRAIEFYINTDGVDKIVFCENSLYSEEPFCKFKEMAQKKNKEFEYLTFQSSMDKVVQCGKGYGEGEILKYAIENSRIMQNDDFFLKVTGRVIISNLKDIIRHLKYNKIYMLRLNQERPEAFTVFFGMSKENYKKIFMDAYLAVRDNEHYYLEHAFFDSVKKNNAKTCCFRVFPQVNGISGSSGVPYAHDTTKKQVLKHNIMSKLNRYGIG